MDFASKQSTRRLVAMLSGVALVATAILTFTAHAREPVNSGLLSVNTKFKRFSLISLKDGRLESASAGIINGSCVVERGEVTHIMNGPAGPETAPSNGTVTVKADTSKFEALVQEFFAANAKSLGEVVQPTDEKGVRFTLEEARLHAEKNSSIALLEAVSNLRNELRETCFQNMSKSDGQ